MDKLPDSIKNKLRQLQSLIAQASDLQDDIEKDFKKYGVTIDVLCATAGDFEVQTEAFTFITYNEGDIEDNIRDIEEVFLYYAK